MKIIGIRDCANIKVFLNDERFRYQIYEMTVEFFRPEEIEFFIGNESGEHEKRDLTLNISVQELEDDYEFSLEIYYDDRLISKAIHKMTDVPAFLIGENLPLLNRGRKAVKTLLYRIFREMTGMELPWGSMTGIRPAKTVNMLMEVGFDEEEILKELTEKYFMLPKKAKLAIDVAKNQSRILKDLDLGEISLYIGIPFCPTRCLYCSFTSEPIVKYKDMADEYLDTLIWEMEHTFAMLGDASYAVKSIYIGGGTPTSISGRQLDRLLSAVDRLWASRFGNGLIELCVEAGRPDSIDSDKLEVLKNKNVTRISINPQTLNEETLRVIGRQHTAGEFFNAYESARKKGFDNINVDIIAGLPGEDYSMFKNTLDGVLSLNPENITVHTMSVKRGSELWKIKGSPKGRRSFGEEEQTRNGELSPKGGSVKWRDLRRESGELRMKEYPEAVDKMISYAYDTITLAGMRPFYMYRQKNMLGNLENVAYSKPGYESYYNVHIMEEDQTVLAFGAGGVSKFVGGNKIERAFNMKNVNDYINRKEEMMDRKKNFVYNYLVNQRRS